MRHFIFVGVLLGLSASIYAKTIEIRVLIPRGDGTYSAEGFVGDEKQVRPTVEKYVASVSSKHPVVCETGTITEAACKELDIRTDDQKKWADLKASGDSKAQMTFIAQHLGLE